MAARYWVGGAGTWAAGNTANWSATSGGAGGASVPTSADTPIFDANSGSGVVTFTNSGVSSGALTINNANIELSLGAAYSSSGAITLTQGTFTTNNYNVTISALLSNNSNVRAINLGSSTVTISTGFTMTTSTNLTFNAGTSQINCTGSGISFDCGAGLTFNNVSFTNTAQTILTIAGPNTFNNLSIAGRATAGFSQVVIGGNQTINGTLTLPVGVNAVARTFIRANANGFASTITVNSIASGAADIDFRDIEISGSVAPISGTRFGDCGGNTGITFDAPKTVYWRNTLSANWNAASSWSATVGGPSGLDLFPLAQDTAVIPASTYPSSGSDIAVNVGYNIGTIDMSLRTTNTMSLSMSANTTIYGDWITGSGVTLGGSLIGLTFAGRKDQKLTSAGKNFQYRLAIDTPGGSVTLQDALNITVGQQNALQLTQGTFSANGYNLTFTGTSGNFSSQSGANRTLDIGSGTWTIVASGSTPAWNITNSTGLTVTGTGLLRFTSTSSKIFAGAGIQTYPTLVQANTGTLTVTGNNKFYDITNTAIGSVRFTGGSINEFTNFNLNGIAGNLLQLGSTNTTQAILRRSDNWNVGANSVDAGNNTGLSFI
ncbi:MAG: hypothetical protein RL758_100 [Pseudomonadota bacterium]|jgi:hypothetical protein